MDVVRKFPCDSGSNFRRGLDLRDKTHTHSLRLVSMSPLGLLLLAVLLPPLAVVTAMALAERVVGFLHRRH